MQCGLHQEPSMLSGDAKHSTLSPVPEMDPDIPEEIIEGGYDAEENEDEVANTTANRKTFVYRLNDPTCNPESESLNRIVRIVCSDGIHYLDVKRTSAYLTPTLKQFILVKRDYTFVRNLGVRSRNFGAIINFLCTGYRCIDLDTLVLTMEKLGGSKKLDQYLKSCQSHPNCPSEDTQQLYQWRIASMDSVFDQYTATQAVRPNSIQFWFRKLKDT